MKGILPTGFTYAQHVQSQSQAGADTINHLARRPGAEPVDDYHTQRRGWSQAEQNYGEPGIRRQRRAVREEWQIRESEIEEANGHKSRESGKCLPHACALARREITQGFPAAAAWLAIFGLVLGGAAGIQLLVGCDLDL